MKTIEFRTTIDHIHLLKVLPIMERTLREINPHLVLKKERLQNKCLVWIEFMLGTEHSTFMEQISSKGVAFMDNSLVFLQ